MEVKVQRVSGKWELCERVNSPMAVGPPCSGPHNGSTAFSINPALRV